jgi:galactokinase/mevalonate kinase-like predicted kinase
MEKKSMEVVKDAKQPTEKKKLTYEELENACHQLSEQARVLYQKLQDADLSNLFKRLDYLFAVVENAEKFPEDFVKKCVDEIINSMTLPENETKIEE